MVWCKKGSQPSLFNVNINVICLLALFTQLTIESEIRVIYYYSLHKNMFIKIILNYVTVLMVDYIGTENGYFINQHYVFAFNLF